MAGLINQTVKDPMLRAIAQRVESTIKPEMKKEYQACIVAGMKLMWSPKTHQMMLDYLKLIKTPEDIPKIIGHGIVKMASIIVNKSGRQDMMPGIAPASIVLMTHALEFVEKKLGMDITKEIADATTKAVSQGIFEMYKITPEQIDQAVQKRSGQPPEPGDRTMQSQQTGKPSAAPTVPQPTPQPM